MHFVFADEQTALALLVLPYLYPRTYIIRKKQNNKKSQWKPSKLETQESFVVHLKVTSDVGPHLERRKNKHAHLNETSQPLVIIVGGNLSRYECLISLNDQLYSVDNLSKAIDVTFKIFHVLHLKYPAESEHIWLFIQKFVYDIKTPWDTQHIGVEEMISNFQQQK